MRCGGYLRNFNGIFKALYGITLVAKHTQHTRVDSLSLALYNCGRFTIWMLCLLYAKRLKLQKIIGLPKFTDIINFTCSILSYCACIFYPNNFFFSFLFVLLLNRGHLNIGFHNVSRKRPKRFALDNNFDTRVFSFT